MIANVKRASGASSVTLFGTDVALEYLEDGMLAEHGTDELKNELPKVGNTLELKFDLSLPKDAFITAMVYVDGKWQPIVETKNNGDGTITCVFEEICPVAFLTTGSGTATNTPQTDANVNADSVITGDTVNNIILWSVVILMSLSVMAAMFIYNRKRHTDN